MTLLINDSTCEIILLIQESDASHDLSDASIFFKKLYRDNGYKHRVCVDTV